MHLDLSMKSLNSAKRKSSIIVLVLRKSSISFLQGREFFLYLPMKELYFYQNVTHISFQWRIQDFPEEGALTPKGGEVADLLFG